MDILQVQDLKKVFPAPRSWWGIKRGEPFTAVDGISFSVGKGEIVGLLGANGAGKTTTIQMLLGTLTPTSGSISYFGKDFAHDQQYILQRIGFASTYSRFPGKLTVYENLDVYGRLYGLDHRERSKRIASFLYEFGIEKIRDRQSGLLSAGETARMMLAKAFLNSPRLVLLDEPTAALDPDVSQDVRAFVYAQKEKHGTSFLFTSHNMAEVSEMCDRVLVLQEGRVIAEDTPEALAATIAASRVKLQITHHVQKAIACADAHGIAHTVQNGWMEISIHERKISEFLQALAHHEVRYSSISVQTPQLEDYFVSVARTLCDPDYYSDDASGQEGEKND